MDIENISVDRELLLDLFLTFSRFEYALKNSAYKKSARHGGAEPDWDRFIASVSGRLQNQNPQEVDSAFQFILDDPPRKQVIHNDSLTWQTQSKRN